MIIPYRHVDSPFDFTPQEWFEAKELIDKAKSYYLETENADGFNVGWNDGAIAGQTVFHAHIHVVARFADEPMAGIGFRHHIKRPENLRPRYVIS